MQFTGGNQKKLSNSDIELVKELFSEFYRDYADSALPSQVSFIDSLYDQFNERNSLSEKQVDALKNIIESCVSQGEGEPPVGHWY